MIAKRGFTGVYKHVSRQHFGEFDFPYNNLKANDSERSDVVLSGIVGKHLTYETTGEIAPD